MKPPKQLKHSDVKGLRKYILKKQKGKCWICGEVPKIACLDHQHKKRIKGTGLIRGVLCSACNVFIAKSENNSIRYGVKAKDLSTRLRKFADYLEKSHYPYIHPSEKPKAKHLKKNSVKKLIKLFKIKYPNKKIPNVTVFKTYKKGKKKGKEIPKKLTKGIARLYDELCLIPEFLKR